MMKKISRIALILIVSGVFGLALIPSAANAITAEELINQINQLQAQIMALQQQLQQMQGAAPAWCHNFNANLRYGSRGDEIKALQTALGKEGFAVMDIEENGQGNNYFGEYTASAVVGFQQKYASEVLAKFGLKYGTGFVGASTRAKLNKLYGCAQEKPVITILSPNGGETLKEGEYYNIRWTNNGLPADAKLSILILDDKGGSSIIVSDLPASQNSYSWKIATDLPWVYGMESSQSVYAALLSDNASGQYKIKLSANWDAFPSCNIYGCDVWDKSDNYFTIAAGTVVSSVTILFPNGGEKLVADKTYNIEWNSQNVKENVDIILIGPTNMDVLYIARNIASPSGTNRYSWTISSDINSGNMFKIIVQTPREGPAHDQSDNYFTIAAGTTAPSITVLSPNNGEQWQVGIPHTISWQSANAPAGATIGLALYKGGIYKPEYFRVYELSPTATSYNWTIPNTIPAGNDYKMEAEIYDSSGNFVVLDQSNASFSIASSAIAPSITVLSPNGGEKLVAGKTYNIEWKASDIERVTFHLYNGNLSCQSILGTNIIGIDASANKYSWHIDPDIPCGSGDNMRILVAEGAKDMSSGYYNPLAKIYDFSDNYFSIIPATNLPDLAAPNGLIVAPGLHAINQDILVTFEIINQGNAAASPATYMYSKQAEGFSQVHSSNTCVASMVLEPGKSCLSAHVFRFPTPGTKYMEVSLDPLKKLKESDTSNNVFGMVLEVENPAFSDLSASLSPDKAIFNFNYSETTSSYSIDMSILPDMSWGTYLNFSWGNKNPIIHDNPQLRWNQYVCGKTLYWRIYNANRSSQSRIQTTKVSCASNLP